MTQEDVSSDLVMLNNMVTNTRSTPTKLSFVVTELDSTKRNRVQTLKNLDQLRVPQIPHFGCEMAWVEVDRVLGDALAVST